MTSTRQDASDEDDRSVSWRIFSLCGSRHRTYYRRFAKEEADAKLAILLILVLIAAIGCGSTYIAGLLSMG